MDFSKIYQNVTNLLQTKEMQCPYNCMFRGTRAELNDHMLDNAKEHIQSIIFDMEQKMNQMEENIINQTRESLSDLSIEIDKLKKYVIPTIPSAPLEIIYSICPFICEIPDFSTKLALAKSKTDKKHCYTSQPFYLFKEGYFACLRIYPNGDGAGKGNYLSVYLALRKGIYDDTLIWPFTNKIALRITPGFGKWNEGVGGMFKGDESQAAFQKPISEMNVGSGCPLFIRIDNLLCDYLINDSVFIEIRNEI